ncbi:hypothetical protein RAS1_43140 [Phycisphaerae bacterium RAS1]|nr:hypothetical protein RAS1_43140 [Phycisphaerae bacterium RAS1]
MILRSRNLSAAAALALFPGATACLAQTTHDVQVLNFRFVPSTVQVLPGDTVRWTWLTGSHTITSGVDCTPDGRFDMPMNSLNTMQTYVIPADAPPTIQYFCMPHCIGGMDALIQVLDPCAGVVCADANCDGIVDILDINAFILAVQSQTAWEAMFSCDYLCANDVNGDSGVDVLDINSFVDAVNAGACQ